MGRQTAADFCNLFYDSALTLRLSGAEPAVRAAHAKLGGEEIDDGADFWDSVREQTHPFFQSAKSLWRLSIKSTTPAIAATGKAINRMGRGVALAGQVMKIWMLKPCV